MLAVETKGLTKNFIVYDSFYDRIRNKGKKVVALKNANLEIKEGEIFGLLGPNGAGKTTFINILATLLLPDEGEAKIFGIDVVENPTEVRKIINLSSAFSDFYHGLNVKEILEIYSMFYNVNIEPKHFISLVGLGEYENKKFDELSSGNKQKLIIAKALLNNPKILLLDELTVALDPDVASRIRKLIMNWNKKNKTTILMATHNMLEAEELCQRVCIIHKGRLLACDKPENLKKIISEEDCLEVSIKEPEDPCRFLCKVDGVKRCSFGNFLINIHVDEAEKRLQKIIEALLSKNYHIKNIKVREPTLEDVFLKFVGEKLE